MEPAFLHDISEF